VDSSYKRLDLFSVEPEHFLPKRFCRLSSLIAIFLSLMIATGFGQQSSALPPSRASIRGTVVDAAGHPVAGASVMLEQKDRAGSVEAKTDPSGAFIFSALHAGTYQLHAEKASLRSPIPESFVLSEGDQKHMHLVLQASDPAHPGTSSPETMQFADQPNFTVAGVTDWTAAGGHGSDARLRTSEDLARETVVLKPESLSTRGASETSAAESKLRSDLTKDPRGFAANHQLGALYLHEDRYSEAIPLLQNAYQLDPANYDNEYDLALACKGVGDFSQARDHAQKLLAHEDNAELHRLSGDLDEELGDPLAAVREDEKAVSLDPSEQNYFEWGSELLLHRAIQPAVEVFEKGVKAHPQSARMQAALGAALFANGLYDEAAQRVCDASDMNPADTAPYIFLGKIEMAAPTPLKCVEPKLARFAGQQPGNASANYYYAMTLWKSQKPSNDPRNLEQVETLLMKAVTIDPSFDEAYLQLGILYAAERNFEKAIAFYSKAIAANPQLSDAHYRLGVAYERIREPAKAKQEFQLHDEIEKQQAAVVERQRREVKQFLIVLKVQQPSSSAN
jgi:tetratricopeptide (TPR) repeat protein